MTSKPKVYFTKVITSEKLIEIYNKLEIKLQGNIAVKVHTGERGNKNFLKPEFMKPLVDHLDGSRNNFIRSFNHVLKKHI